MADWDVFVSYTHADHAAASRIQAFVEDYPLPGKRRALRVFRDKTDLRAGELGRSIPQEIGNARVLMLCCSPAAARSGWVAREVAAFDSAHGAAAPLVPLLLDGEPEAVVPQTLAGREALILDLRAGWLLGRPRGTTRVELLRAVAAAADVPLRELIPWDAARRRQRWAMVGAAVAVAVAAIAAAGTSAWMTQREADAAALRREAETATLRIEAGDVAEGVAALGHALARDRRGILPAGLEVFRHWLAALPMAEETAGAERGLLRIGGRIYARGGSSGLVPMDVAEPFIAAAPWPGRIVTAGPGGIVVIDAATGAREADVTLPPGTEIMGLHVAHTGAALVVLGRMTRVENDEDEPSLPIPCTALLVRSTPVSAPKGPPVAVRIVTAEAHEVKPMRALSVGDLFWHDCVAARVEPQPQADTATPPPSPAPAISITLGVPRIPEGNDAIARDSATWEEGMRQAWPKAAHLPVVALPAVRPEHTPARFRQDSGRAPQAPGHRAFHG